MNARLLPTITLSLLFAACGPAPQDEGKEQKPAAVFENGSILIGSQRVELGAPADAWIAVLGSNYRQVEGDEPFGSERQNDPALASAAASLRAHIDSVWEAIKRGSSP